MIIESVMSTVVVVYGVLHNIERCNMITKVLRFLWFSVILYSLMAVLTVITAVPIISAIMAVFFMEIWEYNKARLAVNC
jgi:hypothetical protein